MGKIPVSIHECPFCNDGDMVLARRVYKHIPKDKDYILDGWWWYYKCKNCLERFTTTESDTISMNNLKQRKL